MTQAQPPQTKAPRWMKLAMVASVSLNLLILGAVAGTLGRHAVEGRVAPRVVDTGGAYTMALSPKDRREIARAMAGQVREGRPDRAAARAEYQKMIAVLAAEPFDRAQAQAVLSRQAAFAESRRAMAEQALLDRLEQMTPEERQGFAARLASGLARDGGPRVRTH